MFLTYPKHLKMRGFNFVAAFLLVWLADIEPNGVYGTNSVKKLGESIIHDIFHDSADSIGKPINTTNESNSSTTTKPLTEQISLKQLLLDDATSNSRRNFRHHSDTYKKLKRRLYGTHIRRPQPESLVQSRLQLPIFAGQQSGSGGYLLFNNPNTAQPSPSQQEVVLLLKFARDFDNWNPRNSSSQWTWAGADVRQPADNAALIVVNENDQNQQRSRPPTKKRIVGENQTPENDVDGFVNLFSLPFNRYGTPNNETALFSSSYAEGYVQSKNNWTVGNAQRLLARIKFSCKIVHPEKHPFPAELVANARDDPRLGSCVFTLQDAGDSNLAFHFFATNEGVWAAVSRRPQSSKNESFSFVAKRRIGLAHYGTVVDAAIEYDRRQAEVNFYLNGFKVWTLRALGMPPPEDGLTVIDVDNRGATPTVVDNITALTVAFGTMKMLDERDPNNMTLPVGNSTQQPIRLVRMLVDSNTNGTFYGNKEKFFDNNSTRSNVLWGQGAVMQLFKLLVVRADSQLPQVVVVGDNKNVPVFEGGQGTPHYL